MPPGFRFHIRNLRRRVALPTSLSSVSVVEPDFNVGPSDARYRKRAAALGDVSTRCVQARAAAKMSRPPQSWITVILGAASLKHWTQVAHIALNVLPRPIEKHGTLRKNCQSLSLNDMHRISKDLD
jgi:hypothetical protein